MLSKEEIALLINVVESDRIERTISTTDNGICKQV